MKKNINKIEQEAEVIEKIKHLRNVRGQPKMAAKTLEGYMRLLAPGKRTPNLYLFLANLYVDVGESRRAKTAFRTAAKKARQVKNNAQLADILRKWGYLYLHTDPNQKQAQKLITKSVMIIKQELGAVVSSNDKEITRELLGIAANCYASLGNLEQTRGDLASAKKAYREALWYADSSGFKERAVTVIGDLGNIAVSEKNWKKAERLLTKCRDRAKNYYQHSLPAALLRLGQLYASPENPRRNPAKAKGFFEKSLKVARKGGWKREQADALRALGEEEKADRIYRSIGYRVHLSK